MNDHCPTVPARPRSIALATIAALLMSLYLISPAAAEDELHAAVAADYQANLAPLFQWFHQNPELSHREFQTAKRLAAELRALDYEVTEGVGGTGVVAVLRNGPGPTVMIRADMDGLPIREQSGSPYASTVTQEDRDGQIKPVMHACGHDTHVTSLVGTARQLANRKSQWSGTLVLIGQPAEEIISGARAMLEDGLYERFPKPDYALALHVAAQNPVGTLAIPLGLRSSSADAVDIIVHGVGAHGASPHKGIDPVLVAAQIVVSLQTIVSRSIAPTQAGVITVGSIHGGSKHNIIGDKVTMQLTVRANDHAVRTTLLDGIDRVVRGVAISMGVPEDKMPEVIRSPTETTPPTINDAATAARVRAAISDRFGAEALWDKPREGMGAEDFAYFIAPGTGVKGVYFSVGGTAADVIDSAPSHHSPFFLIDPEAAITTGTEAMVTAALALFAPE